MLTVQRCSRCATDKPPDAFAPSHRGKRGTWCRQCHKEYNRARDSLRPARPRACNLTCSSCGKGMYRNTRSSLPQGEATCLDCRQARAAAKRLAARTRVCPICRRTFEHNRRTYCSLFCRRIGSRIGALRGYVRLDGEYRPVRWWTRTPDDPRWIIGPPPPYGLDVWTTPAGNVLCPDCTNPMDNAGDAHHCEWCGIRVIFL